MSTIATLAAEARSALAGSFNGTLTGPDDAGYDEARSVYNAMIDRRPALVARCTSAADVAAVIGFARSQNVLIAVRGGGHNGGGLGVVDDGVVIDLAGINSIDVDASARTVRVGGGCVWKDVDAATHEVGGTVPCGMNARDRFTYEIVSASARDMSVPGWNCSLISATPWIDLLSTCSMPLM